jgi:recombinational DNA repair ATPase RecF
LHYWNKKFSELASLYLLYREKLIQFIESERQKINDKYSIEIAYNRSIPKCENEQEWIYNSLRESEERDILTGHTHIGPHRDDFCFIIKTLSEEFLAHEYLSR